MPIPTITGNETTAIPTRLVNLFLRAVLDGIEGQPVIKRWRPLGDSGRFIVLCERTGRVSYAARWVTWYIGPVGAISGHFFSDEFDAMSDYETRAA